MPIKELKQLQEMLIDLIDYAYTKNAELDRESDNLDTIYEIGKMDGMSEAAGSIYLAVFGGKAYGFLLDSLWAKAADVEREDNDEELQK